MTKKESLIALASYIPFGPQRIKLMTEYFGGAHKVWLAKEEDLKKIGLSEKLIKGFIKHREEFDKSYFDLLKKQKIKVLLSEEKAYPEILKEIPSAPTLLYCLGNTSLLKEKAVSIVGTRKMTNYGKVVTEQFAGELSSLGLVIVSGLARGVDTVAHKEAIKNRGKTIAVLGCGLDKIYPPENTELARKIIKEGGLLISEYPIGYPALPINFAVRNRIISGLSKAIVVVEGRKKSGTLLTASHAADQGRTVFAVPGQITSPMSEAPFFLIERGAKIAISAKDILEELDINFKLDKDEIEKIAPENKKERELLTLLENEPLHLDELARISSLSPGDLSAQLVIMEMKGLVKNMGGGVYKKE